ncbi:DUF3757 domain-containing protein [Yersinia similis]|uniref:Protein of uncharacterized function (DUF3757) n=2 Tax=Yersinia similis TaxID=367190 RepID=A0A0T9NPJ4_9GAMM|nr:DUF3757 domain-containing protein [Yersinia similis]CFQ52399.1 Protein of uncharacterised function (DUF3757) [Yersinia similis]CNE55378.1 Protein of uncharacterised function (DUF3757) [Yersinia similis]CNF46239.1 Protein of uncharacterised function (DUF3757) [Yersinia similis]CNH23478.1 Protein of uncharacterised function (DUF3757) [Yersinia similis]
MKKSTLLTLSSLFLLSPFTSAIEITRCPEANEINHVLSDYKSANLRWYGTTQGGENKGNVAHFLQAFYYPHGGNDRALGVLVQCSYLLDAGILQMKMRDNKVLVNKGLYISIVDNPTWIKNTDNVPYTSYTCSADKAEDCSFTRPSDAKIAEIAPDIPVLLPRVTAE